MKKFLIASGVAVLAFASVVGAQGTAFNTNLTVGSTGSDVVALQTWLIANGYSIPSIASGAAAKGYFGTQTKMAVQAYQTAKGIPSTGFVGPLTRGALNAGGGAVVTAPSGFVCPVGMTCTVTGGGTSPVSTGGLAGTDGIISDVSELSSYSNEEVGDGQSDVKVLGMEVEASNDGDIALKSVKVSFDSTGAGSGDSDNLDDYIEGVSVWMGSTKVGSADVSSFNEDSGNIWSKTITLSNAVIRADKTEKVYVAVDSVNNLDSGDIDSDSWTVDVDSIRFEDGAGVVTSDTTTGDIDGMDVAIDFVSFSASADTELKISTDSSSPDADIVTVDDSDSTDDVVLLIGKIKLEGDSDAVLDEFPVTLTTTGDSVSALTGNLTLVLGGEDFSETVSLSAVQTGTVTFDNLDFDISAGSTVTFKVMADLNDIENTGVTATDFDEGDTLLASVTSTNRDYMDVENEEGDQLADSNEKSGTATGEAQEFRTNGIALTLISTATSVAAGTGSSDDQGTFTIKFKIKAIGDAAYISSLASSALSGTANVGATALVDRAGTATVGGVSVTIVDDTDDDLTSSVGNYYIEEGEEHSFTMVTTVQLPTAGAGGQFRTALGGIDWDTDDDATPDNTYTSNLDAFKTSYVGLN
ncbi:MAG: peptidoglycan-binding protein [Candidatus Pacebacteria bacterium]|nr:peptidoglycan-binding protein [Candidatus Paceibacterota bacterium]